MVKDADGLPKEKPDGARYLGVREADYELNEDGTINTEANMPPGLSTAPNDPNNLPAEQRPQWLGGRSKDTLFATTAAGDLEPRPDPAARWAMSCWSATANEIEEYGIAVAQTRASCVAIESEEELGAYMATLEMEME
jgi:hypothetical protein